jgi:hypothetical protein
VEVERESVHEFGDDPRDPEVLPVGPQEVHEQRSKPLVGEEETLAHEQSRDARNRDEEGELRTERQGGKHIVQ